MTVNLITVIPGTDWSKGMIGWLADSHDPQTQGQASSAFKQDIQSQQALWGNKRQWRVEAFGMDCNTDCSFAGVCFDCLLWGLSWPQLLISALVFGLVFISYWLTLIVFAVFQIFLKRKKKETWFRTLNRNLFVWTKYLLMASFARGGYQLAQVPDEVDDVLKYFFIIPVYIALLVWVSRLFDSITTVVTLESLGRVEAAETEEKRQEEMEKYHTVSSVYEEGFRVLRYLSFLIIILLGFVSTGSVNVVALLEGSSVVGLAFVFALQPWLRNMIGGVFIFADSKFKINDQIKLLNITGQVADVTLRYTNLRRKDNSQVYIPNSRVLEQPVANYSRRKARLLEVTIKLKNGTSVAIIREALRRLETQLQILHPDVLSHYNHSAGAEKTGSVPVKADQPKAQFFAGLASWMEILLVMTVSGNSLGEEGFLKVKTEMLLRAREILEELQIEVVDETSKSRMVDVNRDTFSRLDFLINDDDIDHSIMATAMFQL